MNVQARYTALTCATLAGLLMLSACGKNEQQSSTTPTTPAASAPAPAASAPPAAMPAPTSSAPAPASTAPAHPASSPGGMAATKADTDIQVSSVTIGSAVDATLAISKEQRHFSPSDKAIYASVATTGRTDNATLNATWTYVDGKNQTFSTTSDSIATDGPTITTFKIQNPNAWPQGKYRVEISLNGKTVAQEEFDVRS